MANETLIEALQLQVVELRQALITLQGRVDTLEKTSEETSEEITTLADRVSTLEETSEETSEEITTLADRVSTLEETSEETSEEISRLSARITGLEGCDCETAWSELRTQILPDLAKQIAGTQEQINILSQNNAKIAQYVGYVQVYGAKCP